MNTEQTVTTASARPENVRRKIVFDYDENPDFSWLQQEEFKNENIEDHVALEMRVYEMGPDDNDWQLTDSLGNIDMLAFKTDWATGTFYRAGDLPEGYLRELATNAFAGDFRVPADERTIPAETSDLDEEYAMEDETERTIAAEKPTHQTHSFDDLTKDDWYAVQGKLIAAQAHAAKLAEALRKARCAKMQKYKVTTEVIRRYYVMVCGEIYGGPFDTKEDAQACVREAQARDESEVRQ